MSAMTALSLRDSTSSMRRQSLARPNASVNRAPTDDRLLRRLSAEPSRTDLADLHMLDDDRAGSTEEDDCLPSRSSSSSFLPSSTSSSRTAAVDGTVVPGRSPASEGGPVVSPPPLLLLRRAPLPEIGVIGGAGTTGRGAFRSPATGCLHPVAPGVVTSPPPSKGATAPRRVGPGGTCPSALSRPGADAQAAAAAAVEGEKGLEVLEDDETADSEYCIEPVSLTGLFQARFPFPLLPPAPCSARVPRPFPDDVPRAAAEAKFVAKSAGESPIATFVVFVGESSICESCLSWEMRKPWTDDCWDHTASLSTPLPAPLALAPAAESAAVALPTRDDDGDGPILDFFAPPDSKGASFGPDDSDADTPVEAFSSLGEGAAAGDVAEVLPLNDGWSWSCTEGDWSRNGGGNEISAPPPCSPPLTSGDADKLPTACASCLSCAATYAVLETVIDESCLPPMSLSAFPPLLTPAPSPPPSPPFSSMAFCTLQKEVRGVGAGNSCVGRVKQADSRRKSTEKQQTTVTGDVEAGLEFCPLEAGRPYELQQRGVLGTDDSLSGGRS